VVIIVIIMFTYGHGLNERS